MRVDNRVLKNAVLNCRFYTVAQASGAILPVWHAMADSICNCRGCQLWGALAFGEPLPSSCFSNSHHGSSVHPCPSAQPQSSAEASSSTSVDASHPKLECVQPQSSAAASSSTAVDASHLPVSAEPPSDQKTQMHPMAPDWWSAFKHPEFPRSRRHLDPDFTTARRMTTMPVLRPTQVRDDLNAENTDCASFVEAKEIDSRFFTEFDFDCLWLAVCAAIGQPHVVSVYVGTSSRAAWRWKRCEGYLNMTAHYRYYHRMYPLSVAWGGNALAMERLLQQKMLQHFEPKCASTHSWRPGPLAKNKHCLIYMCVEHVSSEFLGF